MRKEVRETGKLNIVVKRRQMLQSMKTKAKRRYGQEWYSLFQKRFDRSVCKNTYDIITSQNFASI